MRHHCRVRVPRLLLAVLPLVAVPAVPAAAADGCPVMAVDNSVTSGTGLVLSPQHRSIAFGGCVTFANNSLATVTITVGSGYSQSVAPGASTSGASNFVGRSSGTQGVRARSGPASAEGSISVAAAPAPKSTRSPSPAASTTPTPGPAPSPGASEGGTGPRVAKTPPRSGAHGHGLHRHRANVQRPAVSPAGPIQSPTPPLPVTSPSAAPAVVAGPIEPTSGRGAGLPTALAALALVGAAAGLFRVLLAEPVDGVETVGGRP